MALFEIHLDLEGRYRWRLRAADGKIVAVSPRAWEGYAPVERAIEEVRGGGAQVQIASYGRTYGWVMRETGGGVVAEGARPFASRAACEKALVEVLKTVQEAAIVEVPWKDGGVDASGPKGQGEPPRRGP